MTTQKFTGRGQLIDRLTAQIGGDRDKALAILSDRGHYDPKTGKLTAEGMKRDQMTAAERAKDRASRSSGRPATEYKYSPKTNRATLKKGFR
jgi:hypothetical protein